MIVIDSNIKTREEKKLFLAQKIHCSVLAGRCVHASSCESGKLVYVLQEQAVLVTVQMNAALGLETTVDITTKNTLLTLPFQIKLDCLAHLG